MRSLLLTVIFLKGVISIAQETKTSIGFALSPNFSSVRYVDDGTYPDGAIDLIKSHTNGALGLSGNIFFQYDISKKFMVTWGVGSQNYRYRTSYYTQTQIEHPTVSRQTMYSQHYIQLNASLKYNIYESLYVRAGIGVELLAEQRVKRSESCPTCDYNYQGEDHSSNFNEVMVPAIVGLGYELKLTERLNFLAELVGTMSLTNAYQNTVFSENVQTNEFGALKKSHLQQKPLQLGFSLGVIRSF